MKWLTLSSCQRRPEHGEVSRFWDPFSSLKRRPGVGGRLANRVSAPMVPHEEHAGTLEAQRGLDHESNLFQQKLAAEDT